MVEVIKPTSTFGMLQAGTRGGIKATQAVREFFGPGNWDEFRTLNKGGEEIPKTLIRAVNRFVYDRVGRIFRGDGRLVFMRAMELAIRTHEEGRRIMYADQDRQATLTANVVWSDLTPVTTLAALTMPTNEIDKKLRYEYGIQLVLALHCAEVITYDREGRSRRALNAFNNFLEASLFQGKKGETIPSIVYSYHVPETNEVIGLSKGYPDARFAEDSWVKKLDYQVRMVKMKDGSNVPVLYDQEEKRLEAIVLKGFHRSLQNGKQNGNRIETEPYQADRLRFRLVPMEGGRPLRDKLADETEELLEEFGGVERIHTDDQVDANNGAPNRVALRRKLIYLKGFKHPIEMIVQAHEDYLQQQYHVGRFDEDRGMHDGIAHDLYALRKMVAIAPFIWPPEIFGIDLKTAIRESSYQYAWRLGTKQRIDPPYMPAA